MPSSTHLRRSPRLWLIALLAIGVAALLAPSSAAAASGALYTQTNDPAGNEVVVFDRAPDGSLTEVDRVETGGTGIHGNPPFGQAHLDSTGAVELTENQRLLFAVNAGSDTISSFRVGPKGGLTLVDEESSDGSHPVSVDSHNGLLYVLNQFSGTISGLRYDSKGQMTPIAGSTEPLSSDTPGSAAQVGFNRDGSVLTVTLRFADNFAGRIDTFLVGADGTPGTAIPNGSNAPIPFSFAYDPLDHLVVANAGAFGTFEGSGSTYSLSGAGVLTALDNERSGGPGEGIATCWVVITNSGKYTFMTNTASGGVSRFSLGRDGDLELLGITPTSGAPADAALSNNSRYLYVLNVFSPEATIDAYRVKSDGSLVHLGEIESDLPEGTSGLASK